MSYKMPRLVSGLTFAEAVPRPACIPKSRPRGIRAVGLRFERKLAKALPGEVLCGQWFAFRDENGHGYCQPDFLILQRDCVTILECKLSDIEGAEAQLRRLYMPVVRKALGAPVRAIVVSRHVTRAPTGAKIYCDLDAAMRSSANIIPILHWLGDAKLKLAA